MNGSKHFESISNVAIHFCSCNTMSDVAEYMR